MSIACHAIVARCRNTQAQVEVESFSIDHGNEGTPISGELLHRGHLDSPFDLFVISEQGVEFKVCDCELSGLASQGNYCWNRFVARSIEYATPLSVVEQRILTEQLIADLAIPKEFLARNDEVKPVLVEDSDGES